MSWNRNQQRSTKARTQHRRRQLPVRCAGCGATGVKLYQDHVVNLAAGGADHATNLQWLCGPCHDTKTNAERAAGRARAIARRGSISKRYRDHEPHPGAL